MKDSKVVDIRLERVKRLSAEDLAKKIMQDPKILEQLFNFDKDKDKGRRK